MRCGTGILEWKILGARMPPTTSRRSAIAKFVVVSVWDGDGRVFIQDLNGARATVVGDVLHEDGVSLPQGE